MICSLLLNSNIDISTNSKTCDIFSSKYGLKERFLVLAYSWSLPKLHLGLMAEPTVPKSFVIVMLSWKKVSRNLLRIVVFWKSWLHLKWETGSSRFGILLETISKEIMLKLGIEMFPRPSWPEIRWAGCDILVSIHLFFQALSDT